MLTPGEKEDTPEIFTFGIVIFFINVFFTMLFVCKLFNFELDLLPLNGILMGLFHCAIMFTLISYDKTKLYYYLLFKINNIYLIFFITAFFIILFYNLLLVSSYPLGYIILYLLNIELSYILIFALGYLILAIIILLKHKHLYEMFFY